MKCGSDNPKSCMMYECGKCMEPIYVPENKCQWREPETNADCIRAMSDEELQSFLLEFEAGDIDYAKTFCDLCCKDAALEQKSADCNGCLLWWLKHDSNQPQGLEYWTRQESIGRELGGDT